MTRRCRCCGSAHCRVAPRRAVRKTPKPEAASRQLSWEQAAWLQLDDDR